MIKSSLLKTLSTIRKGYFIKLLLLSLLATAITGGVFFFGMQLILGATSFFSWSWMEWLADALITGGVGFLAFFLFPSVLPLIANMFQEEIAGLIERREYDVEAEKLPMLPELAHGLSFMAWSLFLNIIMLFFIWTGPVYMVMYYVVNSHLLGREFFEIVAGRHLRRSGARILRKDYRLHAFIGGLVILGLTLFPFTTLFAPFIALALMVHLYWQISEVEAQNDTETTR